jgi:hypothetical protein
MEKIYTRLRLNVKTNAGEVDGLGILEQSASRGALTYQMTLTKNGKKHISKGVFNAKGESEDYFIPFDGKSIEEAKQTIRAYWEVFLNHHRVWFGYAQHFFAYSVQNGSPRSDGRNGVAEWSVAKVKMSQAVSKLSTNGENHVTTVVISSCPHKHDGAIDIAEYITQEIKRNVKSDEGNLIRSYNDEFLSSLDGHATALWIAMVAKNQKWDHKQKIRNLFAAVAVERPMIESKRPSSTWYHKYKNHDYFLDVWSNIHYGYVGLSVGFSQRYLLAGASAAQVIDSSGNDSNDPIDDVTSIKLGFKLFSQFGAMANGLSAQEILNALESLPDNLLPKSRGTHWCMEVGSH